MPRVKDISAYPSQYYWALVVKVETDGRTLFPCERAQAATIQGEFYSWRRVCEGNPSMAAALGIDVTRLRNVALRVGPEGLLAFPESELLGPKILGAVLGDVGKRVSPATDETVATLQAAEALRSLKKRLGEGDGTPT